MTTIEQILKLLDEYPARAHARRSYQHKESGGVRPIAHPNKELKAWLRLMNKVLNRHFSAWPDFMHGGIKRRSYISFARPHINRQCVITIDIKSCFDTIVEQEASAALARHLHLDIAVCRDLANKLCFKGRVAQGFPTSNYLCNLYLLQPLSKVQSAFKGQNIRFGNYVDDLALSGDIASPSEAINIVAVTLSRAKLKMNKAKVKVMPRTNQQLICGLLVNKKLALTSGLKLQLFTRVATKTISRVSVEGWLANLKNVDPAFQQKLYKFAHKKGLLA
jgi:RNA-directed DNA polymerase